MAINSANYNLKLIHINSDGSDGPQIIFDDKAWSVANAPGATLTGTTTIPADFPDGTARLAVKASRLAVPPGLDTSNQELDTDGDGYSSIPFEVRSVNRFSLPHTLLDVIGSQLINHTLVTNTPKFTPSIIALDQIKRYTAPYARGVALCPPLTRRASAPLARPALLLLARLAGENNLRCGVHPVAASSYVCDTRTKNDKNVILPLRY